MRIPCFCVSQWLPCCRCFGAYLLLFLPLLQLLVYLLLQLGCIWSGSVGLELRGFCSVLPVRAHQRLHTARLWVRMPRHASSRRFNCASGVSQRCNVLMTDCGQSNEPTRDVAVPTLRHLPSYTCMRGERAKKRSLAERIAAESTVERIP